MSGYGSNSSGSFPSGHRGPGNNYRRGRNRIGTAGIGSDGIAQNGPVPIKNTLDRLAATLGLGSVGAINLLFEDWPAVVGVELAEQCRPSRLESGILTIVVAQPQWATELRWLAPSIIERVCEVLGDDAVQELKIQRAPQI